MPIAIKWVTPSSNVKLFPKFIFSPLYGLALQISLFTYSISIYFRKSDYYLNVCFSYAKK